MSYNSSHSTQTRATRRSDEGNKVTRSNFSKRRDEPLTLALNLNQQQTITYEERLASIHNKRNGGLLEIEKEKVKLARVQLLLADKTIVSSYLNLAAAAPDFVRTAQIPVPAQMNAPLAGNRLSIAFHDEGEEVGEDPFEFPVGF